MRKWKVTFEICVDVGAKFTKDITVYAGNIRLAVMRAMTEIGKTNPNDYKKVIMVEEVK